MALKNTMVVEVGVLIGRLLSATLVAYGFARLRFPLRGAIFVLVLCTMMIPYHVTLIPQYAFFRQLGWLNTPFPLIVPAWFGGGAFYIFLLRQFFLTIHRETDDAARIDGCGYFGIYWHVIVPMSLPALGTLTIFTFLAEWNDFLAPLIYLNDQETQTLADCHQQVADRRLRLDPKNTHVPASHGDVAGHHHPTGARVLLPATTLHPGDCRNRRQRVVSRRQIALRQLATTLAP